jgi:hypothetical protein
VTYNRRKVPGHRVALAENVLSSFNERAGTHYGAWTGTGKPSASLREIIGALTEWPEKLPDHQTCSQLIKKVFLAKPWWTGTPSVGVVFGPNVIERNLALLDAGKDLSATEKVMRAFGQTPTERLLGADGASQARNGSDPL